MNFKNSLEIVPINMRWIEDLPEEYDRCLHGEVKVLYNGEIVFSSDANRTINVTGYYLLKSIDKDYEKNIYASQLIPCCGFTMFPNEEMQDVLIIGCPQGDDFSIFHSEELVTMIFDSSNSISITIECFKRAVLGYVNQIESFYVSSKLKCIPVDEIDEKAYEVFWNDWKTMKMNKLHASCKYFKFWSDEKCNGKSKIEMKKKI